ncbi:MAG TPA: response regulator [Pseudonocardiaceae bacterium]|nr:response regulator [Pseudonocardiaceae bacterium]
MSQTISAIASLLWPLIVLAVLVLFRGPLTSVVRSTASRDFTIKVAGQEVSVGELHRQQMDMMTDLHNQLAALQKEVAALKQGGPAKVGATNSGAVGTSAVVRSKDMAVAVAHGGTMASDIPATIGAPVTDTELTDVDTSAPESAHAVPGMVKAPWERLELAHEDPPEPPSSATAGVGLSVVPAPATTSEGHTWSATLPDTRPKPAGVLWVDDNPSHNALQLDDLERRGVVVDIARSTKEAVQKLTGQRYQLIVSDMERVENGTPVPNAGLELIRTVRTFDRDTPVVIYGSGPTGKVLGNTATQIGADLVTSSWYELSRELHRVGVL